MKISKKVMDYINSNISNSPPEIGGILGSENSEVISKVMIDKQRENIRRGCFYAPDVKLFNSCIEEWQDEGIEFKGIFHTHFAGVRSLSQADKSYIMNIMKAMPPQLEYLYFPVFVLPNRELVVCRAFRNKSEICIEEEELIVV